MLDLLKASDLTFRLRRRLRLAKAPHLEQGIGPAFFTSISCGTDFG